jgi:hypothetical protein
MPRQRLFPPAQPELLTPSTISFRLDPASSRRLAERAAQLGVSPHELARHYVVELLQAPEERTALRTAFEELHQNLHQFRSDFAFAVEALLTSAGQVPKEEAQTWVQKSLSTD